MELEEVQLIENPQVLPVFNPPVQEAPKENPAEDPEDDIKDNPPALFNKAQKTVSGLLQGVNLISMGVGAIGVVAAIVVPKVIKFNTGWKDLLATGLTAALGGWVLGKISKPAAVAFVIASGGVFLLKFVKWAMMGFKNEKILLDDLTTPGVQPILDSGMDFDEFSEDGPIFDVADGGLFDVGAEPELHPTAGIDDFY
jgi:hypothetical protein